ncbi:sigma 54-interacting transcriptional regulator [Alkalicella caledoniensis]|uniref:Sigma 54-interacting transcriptional regulator n=1 Tax=Alkalicella caledoniensis TaxID=2731377 RepID=A0A7G9W5M2_ALKCA|nr:sigma-54-dependent transcriptional regulator [Alkalicella caledoniensis]QNO13984.1 sigma 54-interacting transcriptional regulator [Alkalicella caledoniensis]
MRRIDLVKEALHKLFKETGKGVSAEQVAKELDLQRANVSNDLNLLVKEGKVTKDNGRPVLFEPIVSIKLDGEVDAFDAITGSKGSLTTAVQQGKAAIMYPPNGLHTLIFGETGVGKTLFAELMYNYGKETEKFEKDAPFIAFNCADYSKNPQLLMGQIFGIKKGAYTGADTDQEGLLEKANGGILFLDEVHRLPGEGQEMLFTYMDKGSFKRLGETEYSRKAKVLIIAATTEDPKSNLLDTFIRRIPMMINIPSLRERMLSERYRLIEDFFRQESARIGKEIIVSVNAIRSLMLYDCPNNIGQLKSDIQLSCARAFLDFVSQTKGKVIVSSKILPEDAKKGILKLKNHRDEINHLLGNVTSEHIFSANQEETNLVSEDHYSIPNNFYEMLEKRIEKLRAEGVNDADINEIIGMDIENYFINFMGRVKQKVNENEIETIIGKGILDLAKEIISITKEKLKNPHIETLLYGLALHIHSTQERIKQNKPIINPKLNDIRKKYPKEFSVAVEVAMMIEDRLKIELPLDEIGFLTMFFANKQIQGEEDPKPENVGILVLMHGDSAASSIAKVANSLLATETAHAIDMPLTVNPEEIYKEAKVKIEKLNAGQGVLILADMGSLINFGDMITKEIGIPTKTVEMVSTPMVLEATRKAMLGSDLVQVYNSAIDINPYLGKKLAESPIEEYSTSRNVIITGCYTGEGSSVKIKSFVSKNIEHTNIDIIPLSFTGLKDFQKQINMLAEFKNIVAVVSFVNPEIPSIPFFTLEEIFTEQGQKKLQAVVNNEKMFSQISETLTANLNFHNNKELVYDIKSALIGISNSLKKQLNNDVLIGVVLHVGCLIENYINNFTVESTRPTPSNVDPEAKAIVKEYLLPIERKYNISIADNEIALITSIILDNQ